MSNWDLMMPGMGLSAIGVAGLITSYSGIAHTFIDGMHALTGTTLVFGLIFLSAGILEGGVSTSKKAKLTVFIIAGIAIASGLNGLVGNEITSLPFFTGIILAIAVPGIVIAYLTMKQSPYSTGLGFITIITVGAAILTFVGFGLVGPDPYLLEEEVVEEIEEVPAAPEGPIFAISILEGSAEQGMPDYDPDVANVPQGYVIEWTNHDAVAHTVTSSADAGDTFDSGLLGADEIFLLDTSELELGEYEYFCIVHPWMVSTIIIEEAQEPVYEEVIIPDGAGIQQMDQIYYDPMDITVPVGTTVVWDNVDTTIHTVTSGTPEEGPDGRFDSELISAGDKWEYLFTSADFYDYYCIVHPWMVGTVSVE